jgi:hypothetical protein
MFKDHTFLSFVTLLALVTMCANVSAQTISGTIQDGVYTNPDKTFRIAIPPLLQPGAAIFDRRPIPTVWLVEFSDHKCRNFVVTERLSEVRPGDFSGWIEKDVVLGIKQAGGEQIDVSEADMKFGKSALIFYRHPQRAPCKVYEREKIRTVQPGGYSAEQELALVKQGWKISQPTAIIGLQIIVVPKRVYRFLYVVEDGETQKTDWIAPRALPLRARLADFVSGFEPIR